jgi:hypothetical protein
MFDIYAKVDVTSRKLVLGRWFDVWAMAVAVDAVCISRGRLGYSVTDNGLLLVLKSKYTGSLQNANNTIDIA